MESKNQAPHSEMFRFQTPPWQFHAPPPMPYGPSNIPRLRAGGSSFYPPRFPFYPPPFPSQENSELMGYTSAVQSAPFDGMWLQNWLNQKSISKQEIPPGPKFMSISEARDKLKKCVHLNENLAALLEKLSTHTIDSSEWNSTWAEVTNIKEELSKILAKMSHPELLNSLKMSLQKRASKRARLRRRQEEYRKERDFARRKRERLRQEADSWLADTRLSAERARKDEVLRLKADSVLSEVTKSQADGRRQVALLDSLKILRTARVQKAEQRGEAVDNAQSRQFDVVIERLHGMWTQHLNKYAKEETRLRELLKASEAEESDLEIQQVQNNLNKWQDCLFGTDSAGENNEPKDLQSLVVIRNLWDQYVVKENVSASSSTIPVGWIVPTAPSSLGWQKLLSE